ncbi:alpha/beta fold hydrolase [Embleya sp. NPDC059237]|uniref:alpha/beta fold hydrolase n=1 Tax=Embleya sp. NPDC059237 TaxID=3346784 RepID=UPI003674520C
MTAFVLVSEAHTGGWIWRDVAARLSAAGDEAYPVTLTGLEDHRQPVGPDIDLETHIRDVMDLIDRIDAARPVVVVGHGYGIHPVLGAADRRPDRVARIVYLDAGLPQDGDPALAAIADVATRERLATLDGDPVLPAPTTREDWARWGGVADLSDAALARLTRSAAPHPVGTLTQPLRLSGAAAELPTTGVLCTGNGASIALVESLVGMGNPALRRLVDPRVGFFELATGHWPMVSAPGEVADVLRRAAADEGHRLSAKREEPSHLGPFPLDAPACDRERVGRVDLYLPDDELPCPVVLFVHGGPLPEGALPTPRDWPTFVGYGRYAASVGVVGATVEHRLHRPGDYDRAAEDVAAAIETVRAHPRVDRDRIALWFFSGGGLLATDWLVHPPSWLRCLAATYPILAPMPNWGLADSRFHPARAVRSAGELPIVLTTVGLERAEIAVTVHEFLAAGEAAEANVEVIHLAEARHGFEAIDHTEETRAAIRRAMRVVTGHVTG